MTKRVSDSCDHDLQKEYDHGMDTGDKICAKCRKTFTPEEVRGMSAPRDVNANVHRIFDEMIERSEQPPNRGNLRPVPPTEKQPKVTSAGTKRR